jgi:UDP-N-acetylglucosamine acyltransferase
MSIHSTAIVSSKAQIASSAEIAAFCIIGDNVKIGENTYVGPYSVIEGHTEIGEECYLAATVSIGLKPQDISYKDEETKVKIGNKVIIREFCSIHRGTAKGTGVTVISDGCFLMNYVHIGHDCYLHEEVIIANGSHLGGHVTIHRKANISALFLAHQFIGVGELAMISGMSGCRKSVPPFVMVDGRPARIMRVNTIGLERAGISKEIIKEISDAYRLIRKQETKLALAEISERAKSVPELAKIVTFYREATRGVTSFVSMSQKLE